MSTIKFLPESNLKVGDTVTAVVENAPKGRNYVTIAIYQDGKSPVAERVVIRGSEDAEFVLRSPGLLYGWLDNDTDMSNGVVAFAVGGVVSE